MFIPIIYRYFNENFHTYDRMTEFGVIIHWGIYSVPAFNPRRKNVKTSIYNGSEWYLARLLDKRGMYRDHTINYHQKNYGTKDYYDFLEEFEDNAKEWNPSKWINLIKQAGGTYTILTVKHHDGVTLYPSIVAGYKGYTTKRDYIREFTDVCHANGISVGLYYSLMEFTTERYSKEPIKVQSYVDHVLIPQLKEIVMNYQPDILLADGDWQHTMEIWKTEEFLDWLFLKNPGISINDRWGKDFKVKSKYSKIAYNTGTDRLTKCEDMKWEFVGTIGLSWGYDQFQLPTDHKSAGDCISFFKTVLLNHGARFTLNLAPKSDDTLDPHEEVVLKTFKPFDTY